MIKDIKVIEKHKGNVGHKPKSDEITHLFCTKDNSEHDSSEAVGLSPR